MELESLTIDRARGAVASGQMTATAVAELHYVRIESGDAEINSFLALSRERAMAQAAKAKVARAKRPRRTMARVSILAKASLARFCRRTQKSACAMS